MESVEEMIVS